MNGATAGSGWWDEPTGDDDATEPVPVEPPLDDRTTQPMPRIDRPETEAAAQTSHRSSSPDTVRVEAPAWFLRAQQHAAQQNRAPGTQDVDQAAEGDGVEPHESADEDVGAAQPSQASPTSRADSGPRFLDPAVAASYREPAPPPDLVAGATGLLGAAMLSVGSFMTWGRATGVVEATVNGISGSNGWGTLACGLVVAFGAVLVLAGRRGGFVGGSMLLAALAAVYFCGFSAVDILRTGDELPEILVGAGVDRASAEAATLQLTSGFAVVAAGAAAALAAGTIAFARRV